MAPTVKDKQEPAGFFARVRSLFEGSAGPDAGPAEPPPAQLKPAVRPQPAASGTDTFKRTQGPIGSLQTTQLGTHPIAQTEADKAAESQKRLAFVLAYLQNSEDVPQLKDSRFVYKLVSDERAYQTDLYRKAEQRLKLLLTQNDPSVFADPEAPPALERQGIEADLQAIRDTQTQLFLVLKKVTGKRGHTGGTGFFPPPPPDPQ